jgi:hypothetical protein
MTQDGLTPLVSMERLCHMEEIKTLRARYVRSVDTQNWEALW